MNAFLGSYRRYAASAVADVATAADFAAGAADRAAKDARDRARTHTELKDARGQKRARTAELAEIIAELEPPSRVSSCPARTQTLATWTSARRRWMRSEMQSTPP